MTTPRFRRLTAAECRALIRRNAVGRLAFLNHKEVDIEPIHYVFDGRWLFGRTSEGSKLHALGHFPYVAFEVDEVRGLFDWRSVVAHGTYYVARDDTTSEADRRTFQRARKLLRTLIPETLGAGDPVPFREVVFGIYIGRLEGRGASSTGGDRRPAARRAASAKKAARRRRR